MEASIGARSANAQGLQMTPLEQETNEMKSLSHSESRPIKIKPLNERLEEQKAQIAEQMGQDVYQKVLRVIMLQKNGSDNIDI